MTHEIIIVGASDFDRSLIKSSFEKANIDVNIKKQNIKKNKSIKELFEQKQNCGWIKFNQKMNYESFYHNKLHSWKNK